MSTGRSGGYTERAAGLSPALGSAETRGMRFEDLPDNWNTLPLDDAPLAAGVIDLVLGDC